VIATPQQALRCAARVTDDVTVVAVSGELDLSTAPQLTARIEETFREADARVLIDLTELTFCDSTGLRALLGVVHEARVHGVRVRVLAPRAAAPLRTFEIAGGLEFLPLVADRDEGLAALSR
jgi:anti-sigma B factor antagonist